MRMDRRTLLQGLAGASTLGIAGCMDIISGSSGPDNDASLWHARAEGPKAELNDNVDQYNDESEVDIAASHIADLEDKVTSNIPAGDGPEAYQWAHDWVVKHHERGDLSDQSDQIDVDLGQFTDAAANAVQTEDAVVGLPVNAETVGLIYNRNLVDEPPETVPEMVEIMDEFQNQDENRYGLSYPLDAYFISAWAHAFGGYYYDQEGDELGITMDETVEGFQYIIDTFVPYMPSDYENDPQAAAFADGNAPFAINGPWFLGTVADKDFDVGVAPLPSPEGGEPKPFTGIKMWYFTPRMEEDEERAEAARNFVEWYATNEDIAMERAEQQAAIPVLNSVAERDDLPENVDGYAAAVEQGQRMPNTPHMDKVWEPTENAFFNALNGETELRGALEDAAETIRDDWE